MQYMLLIYGDENGWETMSDADRGRIMQDYFAATPGARSAGAMRRRRRAAADVDTRPRVRVRDGETVVTDGPFAETKEQLGGYYLIEVGTSTRRSSGRRSFPARDHGVGRGPAGRRCSAEADRRSERRAVFREECGPRGRGRSSARSATSSSPRTRCRTRSRSRARALAADGVPPQPGAWIVTDGAQPRDRPAPPRAHAAHARPSCSTQLDRAVPRRRGRREPSVRRAARA